MDIQIIRAHLGQYKAVRDNITDGLRDYINDKENSVQDRWEMFKEYNILTLQNKIPVMEYTSEGDANKEVYMETVLGWEKTWLK